MQPAILAVILGLVLSLAGTDVFSATHATSHSKSSHSSSGTVHVKGYTRKDGTYVHPYTRSASSSASVSHKKTTPISSHRKSSISTTAKRDAHGRIKRSSSAKSAFERSHPCPATGKSSGPCPGYVVDHKQALKHGGADDPSNMQWQTTAAAKAKDKVE